MARNLWKVIQKQEKRIEELEEELRNLRLRIAYLEARNIQTTPYKSDKFNDKDWWNNQPIMSLKELKDTVEVLDLVNKVEEIMGDKDLTVEFNNPIAKAFYKGEL